MLKKLPSMGSAPGFLAMSCGLMLTLIVAPAIGRSHYGHGLDDLNNVKSAEEDATLEAYTRKCSEYQRTHNTGACSAAQEAAWKKDPMGTPYPGHSFEVYP